MTALDRVLAEEWPDGTFGGPRPTAPRRYVPRTSPAAAARHYADLAAAIRQPAKRRPRKASS